MAEVSGGQIVSGGQLPSNGSLPYTRFSLDDQEAWRIWVILPAVNGVENPLAPNEASLIVITWAGGCRHRFVSRIYDAPVTWLQHILHGRFRTLSTNCVDIHTSESPACFNRTRSSLTHDMTAGNMPCTHGRSVADNFVYINFAADDWS
jgi:hypothetical protein